MSRKFFFSVLQGEMQAKQMGLDQLANELNQTQEQVKAMFDTQDCSFSCMERMCQVLGLKFEELLSAIPRSPVMIQHLLQEQEVEIISNKKMFAVVLCLLSYWGVQDILERVRIEKSELMVIFRKLEGMGFLQLLPDDGFRLMLSKNFDWIKGGPMMRLVGRESENYFAYSFNKPNDLLCLFSAYVTPETHDKLRLQMLDIANAYKKQTQQQAAIPVKDKIRVAVCQATRDWVPSEVQKLLKT